MTPSLERTIFPDAEEGVRRRLPKRLNTPLSAFFSIVEGDKTPRRRRFLLAEVRALEAVLDFTLEESGLRTGFSTLAPPPPPPPPPAPSKDRDDLLITVAPEDLTTGLLADFEDPPEMVLLLPQGGETARRTDRLELDPEGRRLDLEELPEDFTVGNRLIDDFDFEVFSVLEEEDVLGKRKEREELERLEVLGVRILGLLTLGLLTLGLLILGLLALDRLTLGLLALGVLTLERLTVGVRTVGVRTAERLELDRLALEREGLGVLTLGVRTLLELRTELPEDLGARVERELLELLVGLERVGADLVLEERVELERELLEPERTLSWAKESAQTSISRASAARKTTARKETRFLSSMTGERCILTCPLLRR
ncbi:MAG: hypothetical protein VX288_01790 [Planctomycetota bacterium]|nr:hypothetical protein [Planctomycetota bacterium]